MQPLVTSLMIDTCNIPIQLVFSMEEFGVDFCMILEQMCV